MPDDISTLMTASRPPEDPGDGERTPPPPGAASGSLGERPGDSIGPYTLVDKIGEGGFGVVWLAERRRPFVQRVALKIIKPGMDSETVIARFEQERQALAVMDHPNVARVLDGGVTPPAMGSRPYFVMEHVQGESLAAYCDHRRLSVRDRLRLFIPICHAVQHAHHKGIIHRDIKPGNILVREVEGEPVPKVIDFGIAKAMGRAGSAAVTQAGWIVGTPAYMSPEQAAGDGHDIDTRTDVYSLGVVLYELLAGSPPVDPRALESQSPYELLRAIREMDPPRLRTRMMHPSAHHAPSPGDGASPRPFDSQGATAEEIARRRSATVAELSRLLSGELEWIPLKAMRKDRDRRYQSAAELGEDIERYLDGQPLRAGPESAAYRTRKFIARHKGGVLAASALALTITAGLIGTLVFAVAERDQRLRAERGEADLRRVVEFQSAIISGIDPEAAGQEIVDQILADASDEPLRARRAEALEGLSSAEVARRVIDQSMLAPAVEAVETQLTDTPLVAASLRQTLAEAYATLGMVDKARPLQEEALRVRRELLGPDARETLNSLNNTAYLTMISGEAEAAAPIFEEVLYRATRALGKTDVDTLAYTSNLGSVRESQGRLAEAAKLYRSAYEISARVHGEESTDTLLFLNNLGGMLEAQGKAEEAEKAYRRAMEGFIKTLGEDSYDALIGMNNMGSVLETLGRLDEAEAMYRRSLEGRMRVFGRAHPATLLAVNNMAYLLMQHDKAAEAEAMLRASIEAAQADLGNDNPTTLTLRHNLASAIDRQDKLAEAEPLAREVLEARRRVLGDEHQATIASWRNHGRMLVRAGRHAEAETTLLEAERISRSFPAGNPTRRTLLEALVFLYESWDKAEPDAKHASEAARWKSTIDALDAAKEQGTE